MTLFPFQLRLNEIALDMSHGGCLPPLKSSRKIARGVAHTLTRFGRKSERTKKSCMPIQSAIVHTMTGRMLGTEKSDEPLSLCTAALVRAAAKRGSSFSASTMKVEAGLVNGACAARESFRDGCLKRSARGIEFCVTTATAH